MMANIPQGAFKQLRRLLIEPVQTPSLRVPTTLCLGAHSGTGNFVISIRQLAKRMLTQQKDPEG